MKRKIICTALFLAVCLCLVLVTAHYQIVVVSGNSMFPTYKDGDILVMSRDPGNIRAGDVIAFSGRSGDLVKRVAAVCGDIVEYDAPGGTVSVNGEVTASFTGEPAGRKKTYSIPEGSYFVLGDNLEESIDSRYEEVGIVRKDETKGVIHY